MEELLTRVNVAILGVQNRGPLLKIFERERCYPDPQDDAVWLLCGEAKVEAVLGAGWRNEITALRKWPGDARATRRSSWEPYCVEKGGRWHVTCLHPDAVRRSRWTKKPSLISAVRWAIHLSQGGEPHGPGEILHLPKEW